MLLAALLLQVLLGAPIVSAYSADPEILDASDDKLGSKMSIQEGPNGGELITIQLKEGEEPTHPVTVTFSTSSEYLYSRSITFTLDNWDQPQDVWIGADINPATGPHNYTFSISFQSSDTAYSSISSKSVEVEVTDVPSTSSGDMTFSPGNGAIIFMTEGETDEDAIYVYGPSKNKQRHFVDAYCMDSAIPSPHKTCDAYLKYLNLHNAGPGGPTRSGDGFPVEEDYVRVDPLDADRGEFERQTKVGIEALEDDDTEDEEFTIRGAYYSGNEESSVESVVFFTITVIILDNDKNEGLELSTRTIHLLEGNSANFSVKLNQRPSSDVTVTLTQPSNSDVKIDTDPDTDGDQNTLEFKLPKDNHVDSKRYLHPRWIKVSAAHDDNAGAVETATINISSSGGGFDGLTDRVTVTVEDDDIAANLIMSETPSEVVEGEPYTFKLKLSSRPSAGRVTVSLTSPGGGIRFNPATLNFSRLSGSQHWDTEQTVTFSAKEDADTNDIENVTINAAVTISDDRYKNVTASRSVKVIDDDGGALVLDADLPDPLYFVEDVDFAEFYIWLRNEPSGDVILTTSTASSSPELEIKFLRLATLPTCGDNCFKDEMTLKPSDATDPDEYLFYILLKGDEGGDDKLDRSETFRLRTTKKAALDKVSTAKGETGETLAVTFFDPDDGPVALTPSPGSLTMVEGTSRTFTLKLAEKPANGRIVKLSAENGASVSPTELIFTGGDTGNWNTPQTVTVTATQDTDKNDEEVIIKWVGDPQIEELDDISRITEGSLTVKITDDDDAAVGLTLSPSSLTVDEGGSQTFTVQLAAKPANGRTVTLTSDNADVTVEDTDTTEDGNQNTLTFTASNWNVAQTVTVRGGQDADSTDDSTTITLTGGRITTASLAVTVIDDDDSAVALTLSESTLILAEGTSDTFTVQLATQPANGRTVTLTSNNTDVTLDKTELAFTTANWNTAQTVTVRGAQDDDSSDDTAAISLTGGRITAGSLAVTVMDDEDSAIGLTASPASLALVEEGDSGTFTLKLASQPANDRSIALSVAGDLTVSPATLSFTTANWNSPQTVTVSATADADKIDDTASVNWAGDPAIENLAGISRITAGSLPVSITDNDDSAVALTLSVSTLTVVEGASGTFTVQLATEPANGRIVTLTSNNTDVTLDKTELTFTTGNWSETQTVTVTGADDVDGADDTATISLGGDRITSGSLAVTVTDNDRGLIVSSTDLTVVENSSGTFTVKLAAQPDSDVTVTLAQPSNTDVTVDTDTGEDGDQNRLTFTTANWSTVQTVTVNAAQDPDAIEDKATIIVSATGGDYTSETASVTVTVDDNDTAGYTFDPVAPSVTEGSTATFTVKLNTQPSDSVTVTLAQPTDNTEVTLDTDTSTAENQNTLTFTTANWSTAQTVTVKAAQDPDAIEDKATIIVSATGGDYTSETATVTVTVDDDDTAGYTFDPASPTVTEGSTATFTVALTSQPSDSVTVTLAQPTDNTDVTLDTDTGEDGNQNRLIFTTANWNTAQTVTVSAAEDDDGIQDTAMIGVSAAGGDYATVTTSVVVTVNDNDPQGLVLSWPNKSKTVQEDDTVSVLKVRLKTRPSVEVTVDVELKDSPPRIFISTGARLTFSPSDSSDQAWNSDQEVAIGYYRDPDSEDNTVEISLAAKGGDYEGLKDSATLTIEDNFSDALKLTPGTLTVDEGGSNTFTVELELPPLDDAEITVTLTQPENEDVKVDTDPDTAGNQRTLTFTDRNYSTPQTVTVRAGQDDDALNNEVTVELEASGDDYVGVTASLSVTVDDDDTAGYTFDPASPTVTEGSTATFTVALTSKPSDSVTVTLAQPTDNADVTLDTDTSTAENQNTLTFTTANWSTAQTVTVSAAEDDDGIQDTATIGVSATDGGYDDVVHQEVAVTVSDNDTLGMTVSATTLTVPEQSSNTFTVKLDTQPGDTVTVNITQPNSPNADVTTTPTSLTFTTANWGAEQTVTVNGAEDDDGIDDSATLRVSAAGGGYGDVDDREVEVTVDDNDTQGITVSTT
ncbi:MAG: hypothetical protein ISN29_01650, partial [Gammaproteobacteria bacterium AqS3]|nr:hypothetical protein [Gammaproteobacteria bacterium AqS3]